MSDRTEALLAELLQVQQRLLANQEVALAKQEAAIANQMAAVDLQRTALVRQRRALRLVSILMIVVGAAVLLPYAWQWIAFLRAP